MIVGPLLLGADEMRFFSSVIAGGRPNAAFGYLPAAGAHSAQSWRTCAQMLPTLRASLVRWIEYRRTLVADLSREQLALLVADAWQGPARYRVTQGGDAARARRTVRHAARVWRATRRSELSSHA